MDFFNFFENGYSAGLISNFAVQMTVLSISGWIILKLLSGKSAPVRSLAAAGTLISMLCVFILSGIFYFSNIAWVDMSQFAHKSEAAVSAPVVASPSPQETFETKTFSHPLADEENFASLPVVKAENNISSRLPLPAAASVAVVTKPFQIKTVHWVNALGLLWLAGIIFMLIKLACGLVFIRGFRSGLDRISDPSVKLLLKIAQQAFYKRYTPELYTSPKVESPVTIGIFHPIIIIPEKLFSALNENELKSIMLHELAHIYHYDHIIGVIKRVAVAFNWWNPLVYFINRKHVLASEEIADNYVLSKIPAKIYSQCLAGMAEKICLIGNFPAAAGMAGNYSSLEQRITDILSKKRKLTMTARFSSKLSIAVICGALALFAAGVHGLPAKIEKTKDADKAPAAKANPDVKSEKTADFVISGVIPKGFEPRSNAKGEVIFSKPEGFPPIARMSIQADANGKFNIVYPADSYKKIHAKVRFLSEEYAPLEGICRRVYPGKPASFIFPTPFKKKDAVHYTGVLLDEFTNKPVPYVGIFADASGSEIGRADEHGHFDIYVKPSWGSVTHILPYLSSDKYAGHSYLLKNKPGESVQLKLIMERGVRVKVHTEDEEGKPVPGVYVRWMGGGGASGKTDKQGNATLSGMLSRVRPGWLAEVRKAGYVLAEDPGQLNAILYTEKPLKIVLRPASPAKPLLLSPREKARQRGKADAKIYSKEDLSFIEQLYQKAAKKWGTAEAKEDLKELIEKYPKANRAGCAMLYLGQMSRGKEQIKYLRQAIDNYSDCFYYDGVQVGPYARYYLGWYYLNNGEPGKAEKLFGEIRQEFPDAVDHAGNKLLDAVNRQFQKSKAKKRMAKDSETYSKDDLKEIRKLAIIASKKLNTEEGEKNLNTLLEKYPKANITGATLLYWGMKNKGDKQVKYLQKAVDAYSDCFHGSGCQVGPYARLLLARIYLKNGEKSKAMKLIEEIKNKFPDAVDFKGHSLIMLIAVMNLDDKNRPAVNLDNYWDKFKYWQTLQYLQETTGPVNEKEKKEVENLLKDLTKDIYLVKFKPVNGFNPSTPKQFIDKFSEYSMLRSGQGEVGGASFFRTIKVGDHLIASFLTEKPQAMKTDLEKSPFLEIISAEKVTQKSLVKHIESRQESLMDNWKTTGPKIVEVIPADGAKNVDPDIGKITIKFDRKMKTNSWSFCNYGDSSELPSKGKPYYDESGTFITLPLKKLQPNHTYKSSFNTEKFTGFISADGVPLYPYPYSFTTGPAQKKTD
jgi:beta-lactamase regulating signal transducer with metallopeptidase domain